MQYSIVLISEPQEGGYGVIVPLLPGCFSQGETVEEAMAMAREAITLHLEGMAAAGEEIPEEHKAPILASVNVDPEFSPTGAQSPRGRRTTSNASIDELCRSPILASVSVEPELPEGTLFSTVHEHFLQSMGSMK